MISCKLFQRISVVFTIGLVAFIPVQLSAQTTTSSQEEEVVELSPFEVSATRDVGYAALTSIGATRTNTPIIDLPQSINIINQEFLNDAAPGELYDVLRYVSGVSIESNVGDSVMIRGYTVRSQYTDGLVDTQYQSQLGAEPFHFQRLEILKGPSAIVYGSHAIGGVLNRVRKTPQWEAGGEIGLRIGTNNQFKGEFDATGPLGDSVAYRIIGTYRDEDMVNGVSVDHAFAKRWTIMPMLTWRASDKVQVKVLGEFLNEEAFKHWGDNFMIRDSEGNFAAGGTTSFNSPSWGELSRDFTVSDEESQGENSKRLFFGAVEVEAAENWSLRGVLQANRWSHDVVDILPTGIQADNQTMPRLWRNLVNENFDFSAAIDSMTDFNIGDSGHTLLVIAQYEDFDNHYTRVNDLNRPNLDVFNPVYGYHGPQIPSVSNNIKNQGSSWSVSVQDHMKFFEERLQVVLGARYDDYESQGFDHITGTVVPLDKNTGDNMTYKFGVIYKFSDDLSAYYNYSETFDPVFTLQPDGSSLDNLEGVIHELGLKTSLNDGRYTMTLAVYDLELQNVITGDPDPDRASAGWRVQDESQKTKGVDIDLITRITPEWDLAVGASKLDITLPNGRLPRNTPEETASIWTRYSFSEGAMEGLAVGGGVNWQGESAGESGNLYFFDSYFSMDLFAQYTYKQFNFALNVTNVTDEWYLARGINRNIIFAGPERQVRFTVRYFF
jgi:iron complex outermembrane receptor protein